MRRTLSILLAILACALVAAPVEAQRLSRRYWEDTHNGYRFKAPDDWSNIPPQPNQLEMGITCKMDGEVKLQTISGRTYQTKPDLMVLRLEAVESEDSGEGGGLRDRVSNERKRPDIAHILPLVWRGLRDFEAENPVKERSIKARNKLVGRQRRWEAFTGVVDVVVDTYTYSLEDADVVLIFSVPKDYSRKWLTCFEKVGKTFEAIERERLEYEEGGTYSDQVAYHEGIVSRTPGWRVIPTPSRKFIIKTSTDDLDFVDNVIERLELSRTLFERDFPPPDNFDAISVVRICATEEEFHSYGGTSSGTGGWFSPYTTELVLFDYKSLNRNATYSVMSHEAFHQYCHYLFEQSEAHRWFDEGHGDYYGGVEFKHKRARITKKMPAGFDRLPVIKEMVQSQTWVPMREHLNYSHQEWQTQGPSNVSCYAQSWSIIYMLRQGMLGEVSKKIWRPEYAKIIPNYMTTLYAGFQEAYAEIRKDREAEARAEARELTEEELDIGRFDLNASRKKTIWKAAIEASWGDVDLDQFEEDWLLFVRKHL